MESSSLALRSWLLGGGFSDDEVKAMLRTGQLSPIRRGAYLAGPLPEFWSARHLLRVRAAAEALGPDAVFSHSSAALLHGLPDWGLPLRQVHVTRDRAYGGRRGREVHVHVAPLSSADVVRVSGLLTTSVARTVVDVARSVSFEKGVVTADAALAKRMVDEHALDAAVRFATGWPGVPTARRAVAFADPGGISVGESRSRTAISLAGLPPPVLQWAVTDRDGITHWVDFGWPEQRTVAEFDGEIKYGRLLRPGEEPGDAVFREKVREDKIRATGLEMVRWVWDDLTTFDPVAAQLRERLRSRTP